VIEYILWPPNIDKLSPEEDYSFYFEVFGEVSPRIASEYTQVPLPEEDAGFKQCVNFAPMYEYYWSLGFVDLDGKCGPDTWGGELAQTAAEVYLYFPTTGGWRVEEMLATINICAQVESIFRTLKMRLRCSRLLSPLLKMQASWHLSGACCRASAP
jgi:hypothetical protein